MLHRIVQSGQALILIDNVTPQDAQYVGAIIEMIRGRENKANGTRYSHLKQVTVIFILRASRLQPDEKHDSEIESLQLLPRNQVISYGALEPVNLMSASAGSYWSSIDIWIMSTPTK